MAPPSLTWKDSTAARPVLDPDVISDSAAKALFIACCGPSDGAQAKRGLFGAGTHRHIELNRIHERVRAALPSFGPLLPSLFDHVDVDRQCILGGDELDVKTTVILC